MKPDMITLTGENAHYYQIGVHYGAAQELKDMAAHMRKLAEHYTVRLTAMSKAVQLELPEHSALHVELDDLPSLGQACTVMADQLQKRAEAHSGAGSRRLQTLRHRDFIDRLAPRWFLRAVALGVALLLVAIVALVYALASGR